MGDFNFQIDDQVTLPKREASFGPRESKYPFAQMSEGQGFAVPITGKPNQQNAKGETLTVEQDTERKARQKQSAFANIGKKLGIVIKTRFISKEPQEGDDLYDYLHAKWDQAGGPFLLAVHGGPRDEADASDANADAADEGEGEEEGEEDFDL